MIGEVIGHIKEENGSKYLVFDLADENKEIQQLTLGSDLKLTLLIICH